MNKVLIATYLLLVFFGAESSDTYFGHIGPIKENQTAKWYGSRPFLPNIFPPCDVLIIEHCELAQLDPKRFVNLRRLDHFHTTGNRLNVLKGTEFENFAELTILHLKFNRITEIPGNEFIKLQKLRQLYLDENSIGFIDNDLFPASLEVISLSANNIGKLHYKTFSRLTNLRKLDVSINALTALNGKLLFENLKLEVLNMHGNRLMHIGPQIFDQLTILAVADFEKNICIDLKTNITRLRQIIRTACKVPKEVLIEWMKEAQSLKTETYNRNDKSRSQNILHTPPMMSSSLPTASPGPALDKSGKTVDSTLKPVTKAINAATNNSTKESMITITSSEYAKLQQELQAFKDENSKLKATHQTEKSTENKDKVFADRSCEAEMEHHRLEMNYMKKQNEELDMQLANGGACLMNNFGVINV